MDFDYSQNCVGILKAWASITIDKICGHGDCGHCIIKYANLIAGCTGNLHSVMKL